MKSIVHDKFTITEEHIDTFDQMLKAKGFENRYNSKFATPGTNLVTCLEILNERQLGKKLFPITIVNIINSTSPDKPYDVAKFTIGYDVIKGLEVKELEMWRESEHDGYTMIEMSKKIMNNKEIPSRLRIVHMLTSAMKAQKRKQTWRRIK